MAKNKKNKHSGSKHGENKVVVNSLHCDCPRCKQMALLKVARNASHYTGQTIQKVLQECELYAIACPHCGYWTYTGYVPKEKLPVVRPMLKPFGFVERPGDKPGCVAMTLTHRANGACIKVFKTGGQEFFRIGGAPGDFTDEQVHNYLASLRCDQSLDQEKTYLARWGNNGNKLEIFCGTVPDIPFRDAASDGWENNLITPTFDTMKAEELDQFVGILYFDRKAHISRSIDIYESIAEKQYSSFETCVRCQEISIDTTTFYANGRCHKEKNYCPHCGLIRFIEFVPWEDKARIDECLRLGLEQSNVSNNDYAGMAQIIVNNGAVVRTRTDGSIEFGGIGEEVDGSYLEAERKRLTDRYVTSACYLSRWNKRDKKMEVVYGEVPVEFMKRLNQKGLLGKFFPVGEMTGIAELTMGET